MEIAGDLRLDAARGCLMRAERPVHLRPLSYEVCKYLVEHRGCLVGKEELIQQVWQGRAVTDGSIGKCIEEIRAAIGPQAKEYVRTVRGRGYIFEAPPASREAAPRRRSLIGTVAAAAIIAALIGAALFAVSSPAIGFRTGRPATSDADGSALATQYFQNGLFYRRKGGVENARKALEYFDRAVAADPQFARGWAAVAQANLDFAGSSIDQPRMRILAAKAAIGKAVALDDTLAEAHRTQALIDVSEWNWTEAGREYRRAVALNPASTEAHASYAQYLSTMGRHAEALAEVRRAQSLDPLSVGLRNAEAMLSAAARQDDRAIQLSREVIAAEPDVGLRHLTSGFVYQGAAMYDEAISEFRDAIRLSGETTSTLCYLGYALARSGRTAEARAVLAKLRATSDYVSPVELGSLYVGLGEYETAFELLESGYQAHDLQMQFLKIDRTYDSIRSDPRFVSLIRRVGLPE
jgi:DNA-binding winged helix-turn-helix (wHTH) protein/Tfp pilus assembly protein PilF